MGNSAKVQNELQPNDADRLTPDTGGSNLTGDLDDVTSQASNEEGSSKLSIRSILNAFKRLEWSVGFALLITIVCVCMYHSVPAQRVALTVVTNGFTIQTPRGKSTTILAPPQAFSSISVNRFQSAIIPAGKLWRVDDMSSVAAGDKVPETSWRPVAVPNGEVSFSATQAAAQLHLESSDHLSKPFTLEPVVLTGQSVSMNVHVGHRAELSTIIRGGHPSCHIEYNTRASIVPVACRIADVGANASLADAPIYRIEPHVDQDPRRTINIAGSNDALGINLIEDQSDFKRLFASTPIDVDSIDFTTLDDRTGDRVSQIVEADGYCGGTSQANWHLNKSDYLMLGKLKDFRINEIGLQPDGTGMLIKLEGSAGVIHGGQGMINLLPNELEVALQPPYGNLVGCFATLLGLACALFDRHKNKNEKK